MNELYHHGILGQKHGHRNGPPYPLSYSKLSSEEKAKAKESAINRADIREVHANRDHYSDREINDAINRFNLYTRLSDLNNGTIMTGRKRIKKRIDSLSEFANYVEKSTKSYNKIAPVINKVLGTNLSKIGWDDKDDKNDKNDKNKKPKPKSLYDKAKAK